MYKSCTQLNQKHDEINLIVSLAEISNQNHWNLPLHKMLNPVGASKELTTTGVDIKRFSCTCMHSLWYHSVTTSLKKHYNALFLFVQTKVYGAQSCTHKHMCVHIWRNFLLAMYSTNHILYPTTELHAEAAKLHWVTHVELV